MDGRPFPWTARPARRATMSMDERGDADVPNGTISCLCLLVGQTNRSAHN